MEDKQYEGFTWYMALVDFIPVLFFGIGALCINKHLNSVIFLIGIVLCLLAGFGKVLWKLFIAFANKDIPFLFKQLRVLMPVGFLLMLLAIICQASKINWIGSLSMVVSFPAILCFIVGIIAICFMVAFAVKFDKDDAKSNWIEQITNIIAQGSFMIGIIILTL